MTDDPIGRLCANLDQEASALREACARPGLGREVRSRARAELRAVFRLVEDAPQPGQPGRREWAHRARQSLRVLSELSDVVDRALRPPPALYQGSRLGVIRRMEPVRIHFAIGRLGRVEHFGRFDMQDRLRRRLEWLWERVARVPGGGDTEATDIQRLETGREGAELIWGRVRK